MVLWQLIHGDRNFREPLLIIQALEIKPDFPNKIIHGRKPRGLRSDTHDDDVYDEKTPKS